VYDLGYMIYKVFSVVIISLVPVLLILQTVILI